MSAVRGLRFSAALLALGAGAAHAQGGIPPLGDSPVPVDTAVKFFEAVCLRTAPSFRGARAVLEADRLARNPETGTYYHPTLDLSFHVEGDCSMVFSSDDDTNVIGFAFAGATLAASGGSDMGVDPDAGTTQARGPDGTFMTVGPFRAPDGSVYLRALLEGS